MVRVLTRIRNERTTFEDAKKDIRVACRLLLGPAPAACGSLACGPALPVTGNGRPGVRHGPLASAT